MRALVYTRGNRRGGFVGSGVYNTHMNSAEIIKQLLRDGWVLRGVKGSHHIYTHPGRGGHISVPHPKKDLGIGLASKLLKQAGLK